MKFTIDVDWIDEECGLDETVMQKVVEKVSDSLISRFTKESEQIVSDRAKALLEAKTDRLILSVLEKPVIVSTGWNKAVEYESVFDMVEKKMSALYEGKLNGKDKCDRDKILVSVEHFIKSETDRLLSDVEKKIKVHAASVVKKEFNENELIKAIGYTIKERS